MPYLGPIIPDEDPDYIWIDMTPEEAAAALSARKAEITREWGLTPEEAAEDDELITAAAQQPPDPALPGGESHLLDEESQASLNAWYRHTARLGKKRVPRASLTWDN